MATALYGLARQKFALGTLSWAGNVSVGLVKTGYGVAIDTDEFLVALTAGGFFYGNSGGQLYNSGPIMGSLTAALGVCDAADTTITAATSGGGSVIALVVYKQVSSTADSPLIAYIDNATGLPFTPGGGDVLITWDSDVAKKIFKL
jgi:hypothetical protein